MRKDNFYAFYFTYRVEASGNVEAFFSNRDIIEGCNRFVQRKGSQCGYRLHVRNEVANGKIPLCFTFYIRTDCRDLLKQVDKIVRFALERDFHLERIAVATDEEL